jgi:hypothetical protein
MSIGRHAVVAALVLAVAVAVLVALGRWERGRDERDEVDGMARIAAVVGPLDGPTLSGYRVSPVADCLTYRRGSNALALELCVDAAGRVVEAIDRRSPDRRIFSLRYDPDASSLRVDRARVDRLLERMGASS